MTYFTKLPKLSRFSMSSADLNFLYTTFGTVTNQNLIFTKCFTISNNTVYKVSVILLDFKNVGKMCE